MWACVHLCKLVWGLRSSQRLTFKRSEQFLQLTAIHLLLCLLCFLPARVTSCGMSTHIDIAHQAITWFKDARNGSDYREIILKNQDAFIAGNPYPDAMYSSLCYSGKFHFVSEDTHWAPFLNATVNYIRKKISEAAGSGLSSS